MKEENNDKLWHHYRTLSAIRAYNNTNDIIEDLENFNIKPAVVTKPKVKSDEFDIRLLLIC